jgi:hypothetical protein
MEDFHIISAIKEQKEKGVGHQSPLKPIEKLNVKIDKLSLEVGSIKRDIKIIIDNINHQQNQQQKGWWY